MKILYAEDEKVIREIVALYIEGKIDCEIVEVNSGNDAVKYLESNSDVNLVLSDFEMPDGNADAIYSYLKNNNINIPFILLSGKDVDLKEIKGMENFYQDNPLNAYVHKPPNYDELISLLAKALGVEDNVKVPKFCKVSILRFIYFENVLCDVFLRLSERKYLKVINKNESFTPEIIKKYQKKRCKYFYITDKDFNAFSEDFATIIRKKLKAKKIPTKEKIEIELCGVSFVHERIMNLEILDNKTIETMNVVIDSSISLIKKNPQLFSIINSMIKNQNYLYEHSLAISYISGGILLKLDWDTDQTLEKLALASILHDATIEEDDMARTHDLKEQSMKKFSKKKAKIVKEHPLKMFDLIRKMDQIPPDVDTIVLNHHERVDGSGYPKGITHNYIPPLPAIFIISEDFVSRIYRRNVQHTDVGIILSELEEIYTKGNFANPFLAFKKLCSS